MTLKKNECIQSGNYLMADDYHNQIKKVQNFNSYRYYKSKEINFQKEFEQIKANYEIEIKDVKLFFKERINAFEQRAKTNENDIIVLHRLELEKYIAQLDQSISKTVKYSKKYLDIKQKEINAVKSENYIEANYLRSQADELEKEERELFYKNRTNKIENLVKKMKDQQEKERIALKQKFNREYEEIIAEKTNRLEYTRQNYLNKKKNLERNFNMTLNKKCI